MGRRGVKPMTDAEAAERGSVVDARRRKARREKAERARQKQAAERKRSVRIPDLRKVIAELPGYDPFAGADDFEFDKGAAADAIRWVHDHLTHVEGEWAMGPDPLILERWQMAVFANLFGWYHRDTGLRRYRECLIYIPRKNGKSAMVAAMVNLCAMTDEEPGAKLFSAAAERMQARLVLDVAAGQVRQNAELAAHARIYKGYGTIDYDDGRAIYKALSSEAKTKHGLNASHVIVDELHAIEDRELVDVLVTSTGARRQPLIVYLTTADWERESVCNQKHKYACGVRDGDIADPTFLPAIWEADIEDDWKDPKVWAKANPNLGVSVKSEYIAMMARRADAEPEFENEFRRLHLNIKTEAATRVIRMEDWRACGGEVPHPDELVGRQCWAGLDIGSTSDLTSLCLLFPSDDGSYVGLWRHWAPGDTAERRQRIEGIPYSIWAREGWVTLTEGNETDYRAVRRDIVEFCSRYSLVDMAADRAFQGAQLCQDLCYDGIEVVPMNQGILSMTQPCKEFLRLVRQRLLRHGDNPIVTWQAKNLTVKTDENGNVKPIKGGGPKGKIDGLIACMCALARHHARDRDDRSVYEDRGIIHL